MQEVYKEGCRQELIKAETETTPILEQMAKDYGVSDYTSIWELRIKLHYAIKEHHLTDYGRAYREIVTKHIQENLLNGNTTTTRQFGRPSPN